MEDRTEGRAGCTRPGHPNFYSHNCTSSDEAIAKLPAELRPVGWVPQQPDDSTGERPGDAPVEILGVDDWLVFGATSDGVLVYTIAELLPDWLDAPSRGEAHHGTAEHAADWRFILARLRQNPDAYTWRLSDHPDTLTPGPVRADDWRGRFSAYE